MGWVEEGYGAEDLVALFEFGRGGKVFSDPQSLWAMLKIFSRNAKILN